MKAIWNAFSFLAVVHLLALLIFVGWLWRTDRLEGSRLEAVRDLFAMSMQEQADADEAAKLQADSDQQAAEAEARLRMTPRASSDQLQQIDSVEQASNTAVRRLQHEANLLRTQIGVETQDLAQLRAEFQQEQQEWYDSIREERERKTNEQFAKTVKLYESVPPDQGKALLKKLIDRGEQSQAVAYLNAMKSNVAANILREFESDPEVELAADLLENLRTFGLKAALDEGSVDAGNASNPSNAGPGA